MIISNKQVQTVLQSHNIYNNVRPVPLLEKTSSKKADLLVLSNRAQELNLIREQTLKSPEVRTDRVNELKKLIQDGRYDVPGTEVAQKMIDRSLVDELAGR
jgi:negative regulator of flagellin synthesis FlgM